MRKNIFAFCFVAIIASAASALGADTTFVGWKKSLIVDVTTTQAAYSDSWVGGEAGSLNWVSNLNGAAEKQFAPWINFRSSLKLSFGQTVTQDDSTKKWSKPRKSTDLIDWDNLSRFTLHAFVDPYVAFRIQSQFSSVLSSNRIVYFSPMTLTESAGLARRFYTHGKDDQVTSRLGFGVRQTLKKILVGTVVVDSTLNDGGIESVTDASLTLRSNLRYVGRLTLYKALYFSDKSKVAGTPFENDWKAVHVNWENLISASITRIVAVTFATQLLYDKPISYRARLKETVAFGFTFKLA
jgi:hypothetical protein